MKTMSRILLCILALIFSFSLFGCGNIDKSEKIKETFVSGGWTVTELTSESEEIRESLEGHFSEAQLEKIKDYKILLCHTPENEDVMTRAQNRGVIVVCPSASDAKELLRMEGDEQYNEMKEEGKVRGNCILLVSSLSEWLVDGFNKGDFWYFFK